MRVDPLLRLLSEHLLAGVERQDLLAGAIGAASWSVDVSAATLSFADGPAYRIDVIGSAATGPDTWLWAWANQHLPGDVAAASGRLRDYGEEHRIAQLTTGQLPLGEPPDGVDGHLLGLIAAPLLGGQAYYLAHNGPQAVLMVIHDRSLRLGPLTSSVLRTTLITGLGLYQVGHAGAIRPYLAQRGAFLDDSGPAWWVTTSDGQATQMRFDQLGRLASLETPG